MKKSLIALAVVAASGAAMAQSSVTLWGIADAGVQRFNQGGVSKTQLSSSLLSSSQLGFRGVEDLGGGMYAGFWLEATVAIDSGTGGASGNGNGSTGGGLAFGRRSSVDVGGSWGAIRLGRDYTPSFWNHTVYDPFGTLGSGAGSNITGVGQSNLTGARSNNGISYIYNMGNNGGSHGIGRAGVTVQATYAPGEKLSTATAQSGQYTGIRVGYNDGPLSIAVATSNVVAAAGMKDTETNLGASYDLGVAKLIAKIGKNKCSVAGSADSCNQAANMAAIPAATYNWWSLGATIPMGAGYIPVSYNNSKNNVNSASGNQFAIGYVHNLSKRTALYTTYSSIRNKNGGTYTFNGGNAGGAAGFPAAAFTGKNGTGFDLGVRHSF